MTFRYRDGGLYPVRSGETWRVGDHLFRCGDVTDGAFLSLLGAYPPTVFYTDPPWDNGQAKRFRTLSGLEPPPYEWVAVYAAAISLMGRSPAWIVTDRKGETPVRAMLDSRPHFQRWRLQGFSTPRVVGILQYAGHQRVPEGADLTDAKDTKLPGLIIARYPAAGRICDTCSGLGHAALNAAKRGWSSVNNELIPDRVGAALRRLEKQTGETPERVA